MGRGGTPPRRPTEHPRGRTRALTSPDLSRVVLAPRREAPFLGGHPWLFSGSIQEVLGSPEDGDEVVVTTAHGQFVARGLFNGRSQIRVRLYSWLDEPLDRDFFRARIDDAVRLRRSVLGLDEPQGACRLIFSEGDGLSGLTVDRYGPHLSVQFTSLALAHRMDELVEALEAVVAPESIVLRTEKGILDEEGVELRDGPLRGSTPEEPVEILDGEMIFAVDLRTGHKTGFYLDQRENRRLAASYAADLRVADVCCYTGGFGIAAARAGAERVVGVDASERALSLATGNARRNGVADQCSFVRSDAFAWLEAEATAGRRYGMIVLDPPRFARSRKGAPQAVRAYERLNALALRCLEADGILVTCSCSGRVSPDDFLAAVGRAAAAEGRRVQLLHR
ncbi:MAG: class I SAM-dependent rRNA methyltransferase, partial [Planctomycetota bacterium]